MEAIAAPGRWLSSHSAALLLAHSASSTRPLRSWRLLCCWKRCPYPADVRCAAHRLCWRAKEGAYRGRGPLPRSTKELRSGTKNVERVRVTAGYCHCWRRSPHTGQAFAAKYRSVGWDTKGSKSSTPRSSAWVAWYASTSAGSRAAACCDCRSCSPLPGAKNRFTITHSSGAVIPANGLASTIAVGSASATARPAQAGRNQVAQTIFSTMSPISLNSCVGERMRSASTLVYPHDTAPKSICSACAASRSRISSPT